jgi:hypothetical protein
LRIHPRSSRVVKHASIRRDDRANPSEERRAWR